MVQQRLGRRHRQQCARRETRLVEDEYEAMSRMSVRMAACVGVCEVCDVIGSVEKGERTRAVQETFEILEIKLRSKHCFLRAKRGSHSSS